MQVGGLLIVLPAKAGIQVRDFPGFRVAPGFRRGCPELQFRYVTNFWALPLATYRWVILRSLRTHSNSKFNDSIRLGVLNFA